MDGAVDGFVERLSCRHVAVHGEFGGHVHLDLEVAGVVLVEAQFEEDACLAAEDGPAEWVFERWLMGDGVEIRVMIIDGLDYSHEGLLKDGGLGEGGFGQDDGGEGNLAGGRCVLGHSCFGDAKRAGVRAVWLAENTDESRAMQATGVYGFAKGLLLYTFGN